MLQRLSISLVQYFLAAQIITEEDQEVYRYSVEIMLSTLAVYGSILLLAIWGGVLPETIAYYSGFLLIRHSAGGYHASSHWRCYLLTIATYLLAMTVVHLIPPEGQIWSVALMAAAAIWGVYGYGPVDHVNKPFTPQEHKRYQRQSRVTVLGLSLLCLTLTASGLQATWALAGALGTMSAALSVIAGRKVVKQNVQANCRQAQ